MPQLQRATNSADLIPTTMEDHAVLYDVALENIMAGKSLPELIASVRRLSHVDRQAMLCSVCSMLNEIACTSLDHGQNVSNLLASECSLFIDGRATCIEGM